MPVCTTRTDQQAECPSYSTSRRSSPSPNAVKHFASVKTGVFLGSRRHETSGGWPDTTEFSRIQLRKSFTALPVTHRKQHSDTDRNQEDSMISKRPTQAIFSDVCRATRRLNFTLIAATLACAISQVSVFAAEPKTSDSKDVKYTVTAPPQRLKLDPFYTKYVEANGYPIVSSKHVNDYALKEAAYLIDMMLDQRPDVRKVMIASGSRMIVMAHHEFTTDVPEYSKMKPKDFWDARARGLGGSRRDPVCSCGEENLLAFAGDPYSTENLLIHEFAHNIHLRGLVRIDPKFDDRLKATYQRAMKDGLWKGKYASTNHAEYFAEGVQSWFNNNRPPDHDHNHVDTRAELKKYDPRLATLCEEVFGETKLVYTNPTKRLKGHLAGYDPRTAPTFEWPERVKQAQQEIRRKAEQRGSKKPAK